MRASGPERLNDAVHSRGLICAGARPGTNSTTAPPKARDSLPYDLLPFLSSEVELQIKM